MNSFFVHKKWLSSSEGARNLSDNALVLLTHAGPEADDRARIRWNPWHAKETYLRYRNWPVSQIQETMAELADSGQVTPYDVKGDTYAWIDVLVHTRRFDHRDIMAAQCPNPDTGVEEANQRYCDFLEDIPNVLKARATGRPRLTVSIGDGRPRLQEPLDASMAVVAVESTRPEIASQTINSPQEFIVHLAQLRLDGNENSHIAAFYAQKGYDVRGIIRHLIKNLQLQDRGFEPAKKHARR